VHCQAEKFLAVRSDQHVCRDPIFLRGQDTKSGLGCSNGVEQLQQQALLLNSSPIIIGPLADHLRARSRTRLLYSIGVADMADQLVAAPAPPSEPEKQSQMAIPK
jgi:hypothetical protein